MSIRTLTGTGATLSLVILGTMACGQVKPPQSASVPVNVEGSPVTPPSALVIALDLRDLHGSAAAATSLAISADRPAEHVTVLCGKQTAMSDTIPGLKPMQGSIGPAPGRDTDVRKVKYEQWEDQRRQIESQLAAEQQKEHTDWLNAHIREPLTHVSSCPTGNAVDAAVATFTSNAEAGIQFGTRKVLVQLGTQDQLEPPPAITADLQGATVVVTDFPGNSDEQAAWQASYIRAGAGGAVILTAGAAPALSKTVETALSGSIQQPLSGDVLFDLGSPTLRPSAEQALTDLAKLLTARYPTGTAVINGYADALGDSNANRALAQQRAQAIKNWLTSHGIDPTRLQVVGHGADSPLAPDEPDGQPLNRRVLVVVNSPS
jgi:outer membrane protein OmpA-like peptidoglycan-associated protein